MWQGVAAGFLAFAALGMLLALVNALVLRRRAAVLASQLRASLSLSLNVGGLAADGEATFWKDYAAARLRSSWAAASWSYSPRDDPTASINLNPAPARVAASMGGPPLAALAPE